MRTVLRDTIWEGLDPALETYLNVSSSFFRGIDRIWEAESALARLLGALTESRTSSLPCEDAAAAGVFRYLARITGKSQGSLEYVTNIAHLMYATMLLDTFLSETTQFLFLLSPRAMGDNQPVPLRGLIDSPWRNDAISCAALARASEIGKLPFPERIQFLQETFGLQITIAADALAGVEHFSCVSSNMTHDQQGSFQLQLDGRGDIVAKEQTCPRHARKISREDVRWAIDSFERAARPVVEAVFSQLLKQGDHPAVQLLLKGSTVKLELSQF